MEKETNGSASEQKKTMSPAVSAAQQEEEVKTTVLDDDASIYAKREEEASLKKTWKELDRKGKWTFFKDYYLLKIVLALAACSLLIYIGVVTLGPHTDKVLYVAVLLDQLDTDAVDDMTEDLSDVIETDKHKVISIDDSFQFTSNNSSFSGSDKLTTILYSELIDVIITDQDYFKQYSYYGYLKNLESYLPADIQDALGDKLLTANVSVESDAEEENQSAFDDVMGYTDEENPYADGDPYIFGIDLSDCEKYKALNPLVENPVLTVAYNSPNKENTFAFIRYLFDLPE